jgi:hypothetical protein
MLAADALGRIAAVSPRFDAKGDPFHVTGANLSGRPYFVAARDSGRPYISDVLPGRGLGHDAIVAISAPFRSADGSMAGIVEGSLNLTRFERFGIAPLGAGDMSFIVADGNGRIVYASPETRYRFLDQLDPASVGAGRAPGTTRPAQAAAT